jgi:hypothetical protein
MATAPRESRPFDAVFVGDRRTDAAFELAMKDPIGDPLHADQIVVFRVLLNEQEGVV